MYIQRYIGHLPAAGKVVIFDRSWRNRAGVERVMEFCTPKQVRKFLEATPMVERAMVESGIILQKYRLQASPDEQERRLRDRIDDGAATDTSWAPWFVARSEDKKRVRLNVIGHHTAVDYPFKYVPERF